MMVDHRVLDGILGHEKEVRKYFENLNNVKA